MQFYHNGFDFSQRRWNYRPDESDSSPTARRDVPNKVDVLIAGTGPAGLLIATQLARFPQIRTCIIDARSGPLVTGQADGLQCRSVEIFEAFGFSGRVLQEAYWVNEVTFWRPNDTQGIIRAERNIDTEEGLSEFPHVILNQARLHDFFLDELYKYNVTPHYTCQLLDLQENASGEHLRVRVKCSQSHESGQMRTIKARYVVGCDGARSVVRKSLGLELRGDSAHAVWGVADVLPDTDFPDIRLKCIIRSKSYGTLQIIPREGGYLVRIYVELDKLDIGERVMQKGLSFGDLVSAAQRIFSPYKFEVRECPWWSVYEIGQRLTDRFDNAAAKNLPNAFICGDACHTHSPKAGQGMNVSMQDGLNLGWKLAQVLQGTANPTILGTYNDERQSCARELIEFDHKLAEVFSGKNNVDPAAFHHFFRQANRYMAGLGVQYEPSLITADKRICQQELASGFPVGKRFHSEEVLRCADARRLHLAHTMPADGRWRILVFGGNIGSKAFRAATDLCEWIGQAASSPVNRFTPKTSDIDAIIEVKAVFSGSHSDIELDTMPLPLWPRKGKYGLRDYEKVFVDRWTTSKNPMLSIYETRGIPRDRGCIIIVRPDQHVSAVYSLEQRNDMAAFFDGFMRASDDQHPNDGAASRL